MKRGQARPEASSGFSGSLVLRVTEGMVARFMELTDDRSSLHADQRFAASSVYQQRIVHGMLPITFVAALTPAGPPGERWSVGKIAARFQKPAFINDRLSVSAAFHHDEAGSDSRDSEYVFNNLATGAVLATANVTWRRAWGDPKPPKQARGRSAGGARLILDPVSERELLFDAISQGQQAGFRFRVSKESVEALLALIEEGLDTSGQGAATEAIRVEPGSLLAACLCSTLAGMCLPGRYATLLDCRVEFSGSILRDRPYEFVGTVQHKSEATAALTESVLIRDVQDPTSVMASGKLGVKVNEPPVRGPSLDTLQKEAVDLGLKGRVVLITGGGRGIGETTAKLFALHGAKVVVNYLRSREGAEHVVEEITGGGGDAFAFKADVADREQVRDMVAAVCGKFGTLDILVNNAVRDALPIPFMELTWERLLEDLEVVLKGAFNCCQEVLPLMQCNNGGKIINLSTVFTDVPPHGQAKYVVAKSALTGLTRSLAVEYASSNIHVNMVVASIVETDLARHVPKVFLKGMKNDTPMKRHATTSDVAKAIVFLASSLSSFTTGQRLMVTGGNPPFL